MRIFELSNRRVLWLHQSAAALALRCNVISIEYEVSLRRRLLLVSQCN